MSQTIVLGFLGPKTVSTLTPLWLLGIGFLAGMALVAILWGALWVVSRLVGQARLRRAADEFWISIREGVLFYVLIVACVFGAIGVLGSFALRPLHQSVEILSSLPRLRDIGPLESTITIPGVPPAGDNEVAIPPDHELPIRFRGDEVVAFEIVSTENVSVSLDANADMDTAAATNVRADEPAKWRRRPDSTPPFGTGEIEKLYVRNRGVDDAEVKVSLERDVVYPEVRVIPIVATAVFAVFLLYFLQAMLAPRVSAIALATFKSEVAQPLFMIVMIAGIVLIVLSVFIPYNTFGEDIKMLKDSGLTLIRVLCILLAVWGSSTTLADEIDGRTALTVLSKPVHRRSFVLGKFLGISWTTALMFIVLGSVFLAIVSYKVIYDSRESSREVPMWQSCYLEMVSAIPGLVLAFMETTVLAALSVAVSTRLPMFANFMICFTVYVLGHLIPLISQATEGQFEIVKFVGRFSAAIFPNLEAFDVQSAIAGGLAVRGEYMGMSLVYCLLFSIVAMLLALILFEDRDLA